MRCAICDSDSDTVSFDKGEFTPCAECQTTIYECLCGYKDLKNEENVELLDIDDLCGCGC